QNLHEGRAIRIEHSDNIIDGINSIKLDLRSDHDLTQTIILLGGRILQSIPSGTLSSEPATLSAVRAKPNQRYMMRSLRYRQRVSNIINVQRRLTPMARTNSIHALHSDFTMSAWKWFCMRCTH